MTVLETNVKTNRYAAACVHCGSRVERSEGVLLWDEESERYYVVHFSGECPEVKEMTDGVYSFTSDEKVRIIKVRTMSEDSRFAPGKQIAAYRVHAKGIWRDFGFVENGEIRVWDRFSGKDALVRDAAMLSADPTPHALATSCTRCGHKLTSPESQKRGYGRACAKVATAQS